MCDCLGSAQNQILQRKRQEGVIYPLMNQKQNGFISIGYSGDGRQKHMRKCLNLLGFSRPHVQCGAEILKGVQRIIQTSCLSQQEPIWVRNCRVLSQVKRVEEKRYFKKSKFILCKTRESSGAVKVESFLDLVLHPRAHKTNYPSDLT